MLVSLVAARFIHCFIELGRRESLMVTLIVGMHSANWFTVGTISNVQEPLVVLWAMLAVIAYAKWREQGKDAHALAALGSFIGALLSKETAIVWVPTLLLFYEIMKRRPLRQWKKLPAWWAAATFAAGTYVIVHLVVVPEVWRPVPTALSWAEAIGTRLQALGMLLIRLVNVLPPTASDAIHVKVVSIAGFVALLAMVVGAWIIIRRGLRSNGGMVAGLLAIMLAPALNLVPLPRFIAPHYTYFAVVGAAAAVVAIVRTLITTRFEKLLNAGVALWILAMSTTTFLAGRRLHDDVTLFAPEVARDHYFKEGHYYLGDYYFQRGAYEPAQQAYEAALAETPGVLAFVDRTAARLNYAGVLVAQGKLDEADTVLSQLSGKVSLPNQQQVDYNRALIAFRKGDFARTVEFLRGHEWPWREPILMYAAALHKLGRDSEAQAILRGLKRQ
jgi:tetratricopeptide (TPR) repeat protein